MSSVLQILIIGGLVMWFAMVQIMNKKDLCRSESLTRQFVKLMVLNMSFKL